MREESVDERLSREVDRAIANLAKHHGIALPADDPIINYLYLNIDIIQSSFAEPLKKLAQIESRLSSIHLDEKDTSLNELKDLTIKCSDLNVNHFKSIHSLLLALETNNSKHITFDDKLNQAILSEVNQSIRHSTETMAHKTYKPIMITCLLSIFTTIILLSIAIVAIASTYADGICVYLTGTQ